MRVIAGKYGSRPLKTIAGNQTRPTTDKVKEAMFNMLGHYFQGGICLDFYGGSGALAIEAVSRGMDQAVIVEKAYPAQEIIRRNIEMTKEPERFNLLRGHNRKQLSQYMVGKDQSFDLVFLDPPYAKEMIVDDIIWLDQANYLNETCQILCETGIEVSLPQEIGNFKQEKLKKYGQTLVWIFERE
ncbi:16S rRNA (guanine(966)-N(2))-methyltransferase RsmD [Eremococcus coleocola]|uniref:16S rRNA (guanine(966)-N(2))-methyltransferase RsmD n=1 Tax=Eremococcus coleocola TaxID=88132 RepID=UPI0003FFE655|nr:16S rRNA (guanine(966)-N(2))-methyltransferase RsmD [Eremococcus coleocola]